MRRFECIGIAQRVLAHGNLEIPVRKYFRCVKYLREPTDVDWDMFFDVRREFVIKVNSAKHDDDGAGSDFDDRVPPHGVVKSGEAVAMSSLLPRTQKEVKTATIPSWCPDRTLVHVLYEAIHNAGLSGCPFTVSLYVNTVSKLTKVVIANQG